MDKVHDTYDIGVIGPSKDSLSLRACLQSECNVIRDPSSLGVLSHTK